GRPDAGRDRLCGADEERYPARPATVGVRRRGRRLGYGQQRPQAVYLARTLSSYIARQFLGWFCGVFGAMALITFLIDYIELIRRGASRSNVSMAALFEMAA